MNRVTIGRVRAAHGIRGELKVEPMTDDPRRYEALTELYLERAGQSQRYIIQGVRYQKADILLKLEGIDDRNQAEREKGALLRIDKALRADLPQDRFYIDDLVGLQVYEGEQLLGRLSEVLQPGANDVYVVRTESGRHLYIPALKAVVVHVDIAAGRMEVRLPEGLTEQ